MSNDLVTVIYFSMSAVIKEGDKKREIMFLMDTWAQGSLWQFDFKDDAVCDVSHPLHGPVSEAEHFNPLENIAPGIK